MEILKPLTDEEIEKHLEEAAKKAGQPGNDITKEEVDKIKEAFKKEEFRNMFQDYMDEISDPKYRAENEAYLSQLERENNIPAGKKLVRPQAGFVVKVKRATGDKEKVFINIVKSLEVKDATSSMSVSPDGKNGELWELPNMLGPMRLEKDKEGNLCSTVDMVFSPNTIQRTEIDDRFKKLVVQTAIEAVERHIQKDKKTESLERKFNILKNVPYKGEKIQTMIISTNEPKGETKTAPPKKETALPTKPKEEIEKEADLKPVSSLPPGVTIPKYTIVHRGSFDLISYQESETQSTNSRPRELVVKISLPKCSSASGIALDVTDVSDGAAVPALVLEKTGTYLVNIKLPYPVHGNKAGAKFDKDTKTLVVTIPVQQPPKPKAKPFQEPKKEIEEEVVENSHVSKTINNMLESKTDEINKDGSKEKTLKEVHSRWVNQEASNASPSPFTNTSTAPIPVFNNSSSVKEKKVEAPVKNNTNGEESKQSSSSALPYIFKPDQYTLTLNNNVTLDRCKECLGVGVSLIVKDGMCNHCLSNVSKVEEVAAEEVELETTDVTSLDINSAIKPEYKYRESASSVFISFQMEGIDPASVKMDCKEKSMSLLFVCKGQLYSLDLNLAGKIDPVKCKSCVANLNMLIILSKTLDENVMWQSLEEGGNSLNKMEEFEDNVNDKPKESEVKEELSKEEHEKKLAEMESFIEAKKKNFAPASFKNSIMYELE